MGHQRVVETWGILLALCLAASAAAALPAHPLGRVTSDGSLDPPDGAFDIERLPGWDAPLPSRHRAGYVTVSPPRRLYYYLVGSESPTPETDPLILWLSGGPGCSSLDAFVYEHGPFKFHIAAREGGSIGGSSGDPSPADDVTLSRNPHSWSRLGHVLYVDSPAGTGMSYSTDPEDRYQSNDHQTVEDLLQLVLGVMRDVPDMRGRDVYLAGESYAGIYVPLLAQRIVRHNKEAAMQQQQQGNEQQDQSQESALTSTPKIAATRRRRLLAAPVLSSVDGGWRHRRVRLAGYLVGNGVTDDRIDGDSQVPYAFGAGLLDAATHAFVASACNGSYWNARRGGRCWDALELADAAVGPINPYDVGSPCFFPRAPAAEATRGGVDARVWPLAARFEAGSPIGNWWSGAAAAGGKTHSNGRSSSSSSGRRAAKEDKGNKKRLGHIVPCADRRAALAYFNDPKVRQAIHAAPAKVAGRWEPCSDVLHYTHTAPSMVGVHKHLVAAGVRALVYSGLSDYVVPFTGTREWTAALGLPIEFPWRPWKLGRQVAGHAVRYRSQAPEGSTAAAVVNGGDGSNKAAVVAKAAGEEGAVEGAGGGRWPGGDGGGALTFATVIGAGHMVPQSRPEAAVELLRAWLAREL